MPANKDKQKNTSKKNKDRDQNSSKRKMTPKERANFSEQNSVEMFPIDTFND